MKKQIIAVIAAAVLAALGIFALVKYADDADDRALEGTKTVTVLRATVDIPAKTPVEDLGGSVEEVKIAQAAAIPGALTSLDDQGGRVTSVAIVAGDQLSAAKFAKTEDVTGPAALPDGQQELTFPITGPRLAGGTVAPGDRLGFFASYGGVTANPINGLLVLKVQGGVVEGSDQVAGITAITVAVDTFTAEQIIHAQEFGTTWLTLQNDKTDTGGGRTITQQDVAP